MNPGGARGGLLALGELLRFELGDDLRDHLLLVAAERLPVRARRLLAQLVDEIEAPADGTLAAESDGDGVEVPVGTVIALVLAEGEALAEVPEPVVAVATAAAANGGPEPSNSLLLRTRFGMTTR